MPSDRIDCHVEATAYRFQEQVASPICHRLTVPNNTKHVSTVFCMGVTLVGGSGAYKDRSGSQSSMDSCNANDEIARFENRLNMKIPTLRPLSGVHSWVSAKLYV